MRELYIYFSWSFVEEIGGCGANNVIATLFGRLIIAKRAFFFFQAKLFLALAGLKNNNVGFCRQEQTLLF